MLLMMLMLCSTLMMPVPIQAYDPEDIEVGNTLFEKGDKIKVLNESLEDRAFDVADENFNGAYDDAFESLVEFLSKIKSRDFEKWIKEKEDIEN